MHYFFDLFSNFYLLFSVLIRWFLNFYVWILGKVKFFFTFPKIFHNIRIDISPRIQNTSEVQLLRRKVDFVMVSGFTQTIKRL